MPSCSVCGKRSRKRAYFARERSGDGARLVCARTCTQQAILRKQMREELALKGRRPKRGDYILNPVTRRAYGPIVRVRRARGEVVRAGKFGEVVHAGWRLPRTGCEYASEVPAGFVLATPGVRSQ